MYLFMKQKRKKSVIRFCKKASLNEMAKAVHLEVKNKYFSVKHNLDIKHYFKLMPLYFKLFDGE